MFGRSLAPRNRQKTTALPDVESIIHLLEAEMRRARRYGRPLAFARFVSRDGEHVAVRETDIAARTDSGGHILAMPETTPAQAEQFLNRIESQLLPHGTTNVVCFPKDGVTLAAVLAALVNERSMVGPAASDPGVRDESSERSSLADMPAGAPERGSS